MTFKFLHCDVNIFWEFENALIGNSSILFFNKGQNLYNDYILILNKLGSAHFFPIFLNRLLIYFFSKLNTVFFYRQLCTCTMKIQHICDYTVIMTKIEDFFIAKTMNYFFHWPFQSFFFKVHFMDLHFVHVPFNLMGVMVFTWFQKIFFSPTHLAGIFFSSKFSIRNCIFFIKKTYPSLFQVKWSLP